MLTSLTLLLVAPQLVTTGQLGQPLPSRDGGYTWEYVTPGNTGIPGDTTNTLFLDQNDQPWVAGYVPAWKHGGMAHFDGQHWLTISNVDYPVIKSPVFNDIVADDSGVMWIGSDQGLLRFDPAAGPASLKLWDKSNSPLPGNQLSDLAFDPNGDLWIASEEIGFAWGGLVRFRPSTAQWQVWTTQTGLPWAGQWPGWDSVEHVAVVPDTTGGFTVWFNGEVGMGTWKAGALSWFGSPLPGAPITPLRMLSDDAVDEQGNLWMETNQGIAYQGPAGTLTLVGNPPGLTTEVSRVAALSGGRAMLGTFYSDVWIWDGSWSYHSNWAGPSVGSGSHTYVLKEDSQGNLWAGGIGGAAKFENGQWQRYRMTNSGMLGYFTGEIVFGNAGEVLISDNAGTGIGGFSIFDGEDWFCVNDYTYGLGGSWGLPSDDVAALAPRSNGHVAVAPSGGSGLYDWDGTSFNALLQYYSVQDLTEDTLGRLWAVVGNQTVWLLEAGQNTQFLASNSPLIGGSISDVLPDTEPGFVWLISQFGVIRTDGVEWDVYPRELMGLSQNSLGYYFTSGDLASDGTLWLGTGVGLYHFNPVTLDYEVRTAATSALPVDDIDNVVVATDGSVWCSTFKFSGPGFGSGGLTHFEGSQSATYSSSNSPLPHNQIETLAVRGVGPSYELWVGTASQAIAVIRPRPKATQKP